MPTLHKLMAALLGVALPLAAAPLPDSKIIIMAHYSGNKLLEYCKGTGPSEAGFDPVDYGICVGYLAGVNDAEQVSAAMWHNGTFCTPEGTTPEQRRQVFLRYMDQRPEAWHSVAAILATLAFIEAWPCAD